MKRQGSEVVGKGVKPSVMKRVKVMKSSEVSARGKLRQCNPVWGSSACGNCMQFGYQVRILWQLPG